MLNRTFRIVISLGMGFGITGIYLSGPDPDVCWDCTNKANPTVAIALFVTTTLVMLRLCKKMADIERKHGW